MDRGLTLTVESEFNTFIKSENEADYDYDCTLYRWSMEESVKEISEGFARSTGKSVGNIKDIEVLERVNGGAAVKVKVTGDKGETVIDSESAIRAAFGNANVDMNTKSGTTRYANLPSTFCVFEKVMEGKKLAGFRITGGGYGHGIGMSQNAANKMAESMTYAQILEFFYALIFMILIIASLILMVFGNNIMNFTMKYIPQLTNVVVIFRGIFNSKHFLFPSIFTLFFTIAFSLVSRRGKKFYKEIPGAFFSALGWYLFTALYSLYVGHSPNFSYMYGSLATIIIAIAVMRVNAVVELSYISVSIAWTIDCS